MEFWRTILVLLRRKSVALPVLLIPLGMSAVTYFVMPPRYMSTATIVLTTSVNGGILSQDPTRPPSQINPLRNFDGMKTAAAILIQVINTRDVANQLDAATGGTATFTVSDGSAVPQLLGSNGPFMVIEGYSASSTAARTIVVRVEQRLRDELNRQQRALNAPPSTFLDMINVVPPSVPEAQNGTKLKVAAGALVLGLIGCMGVAYCVHRPRARVGTATPSPDPVAVRRAEALTSPGALNSSVGIESHRT